jgi:Holliday junction resolvase RusA-like endonuclease
VVTAPNAGTRISVVTEVWVPGAPKTKGSLDHIGGGRVRENVIGSKTWRALVARQVAFERMQRGFFVPTSAPVGVRVLFRLPAPVGLADLAPGALIDHAPIEERVGDTDKLYRNVLDALQDAGAYRNDNQVCKLSGGKVYATDGEPQGAFIQCWELLPWEIRALRRTVRLVV